MAKKKGTREQRQAAADAAYRKALGLDTGEKMPSTLGQASSAGGGRGASGVTRPGLLQRRRRAAAATKKTRSSSI